jgi:cation:H+ antiporter
MLINILLMILGMAVLVKGGDFLVDGASSLARRLKMSELAVGLTVVAFGTSAPELAVSFVANINLHPEIALGNVIGSNNINLFVVLGITGLIAPIVVQKNTVRAEIPFSLFSVIILFLLANYGFIGDEKNMLNRIDGLILLMFFAIFVFYVFKNMKTSEIIDVKPQTPLFSFGKSSLFIVLGMTLLVLGGKIVVDSAVNLAVALNISEKVIALTIVALGTSLPELAVSVIAVTKKNEDIAVGNIIGSNIFNILLILGVSASAHSIKYSPIFNNDIYLLVFGTLLLLFIMFIGKKRIFDRPKAAVFVLLYVVYAAYLIMKNE